MPLSQADEEGWPTGTRNHEDQSCSLRIDFEPCRINYRGNKTYNANLEGVIPSSEKTLRSTE